MEIAALIAFIISCIGMMYCVGELDKIQEEEEMR